MNLRLRYKGTFSVDAEHADAMPLPVGDYLIISVDGANRIIFYSAGGSALYGVTRETFLAMLVSNHGGTRDDHVAKLRRRTRPAILVKGVADFEILHHLIPLSVCWRSELLIKAYGMGVFDSGEHRNFLAVKKVVHDRTHRQYAHLLETALEDRWRALIEAGASDDAQALRFEIDDVQAIGLEAMRGLEQNGYAISGEPIR